MKPLAMLLVCFAAASCFGATALDVRTEGEWSEPVDGVRGRLLFGEEDAKLNGNRIGMIYLELQNVSDNASPEEIYFDIRSALKCELLDAGHKVVPPVLRDRSIETPGSYWIALPHDSSMRFRVSVTGHSCSKNAGLVIGMMRNPWVIPADARDDYFFRGAFHVDPPKGERRRPWQGVLKLPEVRIPAKGP
jgi:hypothetical protein